MSLGDRDAFLDKLWSDDLLDRRHLAQRLEDYITGRFANPAPGGGSFTIALEGPYGQGKSFFLDRLGKQLSYSHPIAFVNAWADDTADDPLTSLFLAIEAGLAEKVKFQSESKRRDLSIKVKSVAKIAAKVAVRAAGARLLTKEGVAELESAFEAGVDDLFDLKTEKETAALLVSRRTLISEFRDRLSSLLDALEENGLFTRPLVIIIDELDRCRPTYAIRVLEEAKHFFDDTGTVFVYGMNKSALTATVRSIYGEQFPAEHYLARFVRRQVRLPESSLEFILKSQFELNPEIASRFMIPDENGESNPENIIPWLSRLFSMNDICARDAEYILEGLFSFSAIWNYDWKIDVAYLALLAVRRYSRERGDSTPVQDKAPPIGQIEGHSLLMRYQQVSSWTPNELHVESSRSFELRPLISSIFREFSSRFPGDETFMRDQLIRSYLSEYPSRLDEVGKFVTLTPPPPPQ
jgi:hypothetical protein